ncbi:thioredoxin family protein [Halosimplex sp. J119]
MAATHDRPITPSSRDDLDELVADNERVLVEFHTAGCGKCKAMEPVLSGVARTTDVVVATMNPRDDPVLVDEYDVRSVPKLLLFVDGDLVGTREDGVLSVEEVQAFVNGEE